MRLTSKFNCIILLAIFFWRANSISNPISIQVNQDAELLAADGKTKQALRKDTVETVEKSQPVTIVSPGKVPMVIVPVDSSKTSKVNISLVDVKAWPSNVTQEYLDKALNEIMEECIQIQILIQANNPKQALEKIERLEMAYPKLAYLNFFKASSYILQGKKSLATKAVQQGLNVFPKNEEGLKLLKALGGSE